jgi:alkyl hydroperoxide reductase subunit AhpC
VADTTGSVSRHFDVIDSKTGLGNRAAFIIDNTRQVRFSFVLEDNRISHSMDTICAFVSHHFFFKTKSFIDDIIIYLFFHEIASKYIVDNVSTLE